MTNYWFCVDSYLNYYYELLWPTRLIRQFNEIFDLHIFIIRTYLGH